MGYRRMKMNELKSIYRRWIARHSITEISHAEGFKRKTVGKYINAFKENGLGNKAISKGELHKILLSILPKNKKPNPIQKQFEKYTKEITELISDKYNPVKPKTAFEIIKTKYKIDGSYESFKIFMRKSNILNTLKEIFPRLELEPGQEVQIDYCFAGYHTDSTTGKRRKVNGFIGKLSSSRFPFVEFTYTQKQDEFVNSNVHMVEFFEGTTLYITLDNLKAGVIKPHIYDPKINKAYSEFAEHYGVFINPCVVRHPKGKAKVERQVKEVKELFRKLVVLHPTYSLAEINKEALKWCINDYGMKKHGTTGLKPYKAFLEHEKPSLKPLNPIRFEAPKWKSVNVGWDQFFTFNKKRYAMPSEYRQKSLFARNTGKILEVYDENNTLLRTYVLNGKKMQYFKGDFPESFEAMMEGQYPQYLIRKASEYGPDTKNLIEMVLQPHAFLNARCARGILKIIDEYKDIPLLQDICAKACKEKIKYPKKIKAMLEDEKNQLHFDFIHRSLQGEKMVRDVNEFLN